jgi:hypothetical protein
MIIKHSAIDKVAVCGLVACFLFLIAAVIAFTH